MNNLIKLLSILQLTKEQPLTGYLIGGMTHGELPTLAEHHYTAAMTAYFLGRKITRAGGKINEQKLLLMILVHDLSELFGGDISSPLNRKHPDLRAFKDKIGERAMSMLTQFMDAEDSEEILRVYKEMENYASDEAVIAKITDQIDHQLFMEHKNFQTKNAPFSEEFRPIFVDQHILKLVEKIKDAKTKKVLEDFLQEFKTNFLNKGYQAVSFLME